MPSQEENIPSLPEFLRKRLLSQLKKCVAPSIFLSAVQKTESWFASSSHSKLTQNHSKSLLSKVSVSLELGSHFDNASTEVTSDKSASRSSVRDFSMADFCFEAHGKENLHAGSCLKESDIFRVVEE